MSGFDPASLGGKTCNSHRMYRCSDCAWVEVNHLRKQVEAYERGWFNLVMHWGEVEARSEEAHKTYQEEAHRRGDVRHPDAYADLSEPTKEWDRVLVRWVQKELEIWHTLYNQPPAVEAAMKAKQ